MNHPPVVVIGAGPVGLVAAAHLLWRGETPLVLEAGASAGASVREWAHVRLFSPWRELTDPVAASFIPAWTPPEPEHLPTGGELLAGWIEPLAGALARHVRSDTRVTAVTRVRKDKLKDSGRDTTPFEVRADGPHGETRMLARAVIDASGTWRSPNPLGANGTAALGEARHQDRIAYGIPDVLGRDRARYAGRRVLVVGSGHSAFNALLDLVSLAVEAPGTRVEWAIRRQPNGSLYGGGAADALAARGALGSRLRAIVGAGLIVMHHGFHTERVERTDDGLLVLDEDRAIGPVDEIVVCTGFRPDLSLTRELRLDLDKAIECPTALGPLIDPNVHSCGTVRPHGFQELSHPEAGFYTVGMKSYGRAPTFLLLTGYEQVRSVVAALAGALDEARQVKLVLPETGVCSSGPAAASTCCAPVQKPFLQLARLPGACGCD